MNCKFMADELRHYPHILKILSYQKSQHPYLQLRSYLSFFNIEIQECSVIMYIHLDCSLQKSRLLLHPYVLQVSNRSGLPIALLQTPTQTYPCFPLQNIYKRKGNLSQLAGLHDQSVGGENSAWQDNSLHLNSNFRQEGCKLQLVTLAKVYEIKYIQKLNSVHTCRTHFFYG